MQDTTHTEPRDIPVYADPDLNIVPERRLAIAVLHLAVSDLRRGNAHAKLWWRHCDDALAFWCGVLDLNPVVVKERALASVVGKSGQRVRPGKYRDRRKPEPELETSNP